MARRAASRAQPARAEGEGSVRLAAAVREQQRLLDRAATALDSAGPDVVHQGRVAARRLRSMLKTFRPLLEPRRARLYRIDLRSFARTLGGVREADVRRDLLLELARDDESLGPAGHERLEALLDDLCIEARDSLQRHLREPGWHALQRALGRHAEGDALFVDRDAPLGRVVELANDAWKRPVRLLKARPESAAELHELRLALKHCRYALEPLADVAPKPTHRLIRRLRGAQDTLGEHRDVLLAGHWARLSERRLGRALTSRLMTLLDGRERALRASAIRRIGRLRPALKDWRRATRRVRKTASPRPG